MKALDLFCGAGGASMGLAQAGYEVVGVDIAEQPHYPFRFLQEDAMTFPLEGYDLIWASPPCQAYSLAQRIMKNEHPDLIPSLRRRLHRTGTPYVIENVEGAPLRDPVTLCGAMFHGLKTYRHRLFECSFPVQVPAHPEHFAKLRKMGRKVLEGEFMHVVGNFVGVSLAREAMGIDWMVRDELRESIPPAYSYFIAVAAMQAKIKAQAAEVERLNDEIMHETAGASL